MRFLIKAWNSPWRVPLICVVFALSPFLISLPGGIFGLLLGYNLNEGGTDACIRFGIPFGDILYPSSVIPWFSLLTIPAGFGALALWSLWKGVKFLRTGR